MRGYPNCLFACIAIVAGLVFAQPTRPPINVPEQCDYDIVIRGGRVFDGAGNPCIFADVAIKDARFVKIGKWLRSGAKVKKAK